jgi:hypothetical protein
MQESRNLPNFQLLFEASRALLPLRQLDLTTASDVHGNATMPRTDIQAKRPEVNR